MASTNPFVEQQGSQLFTPQRRRIVSKEEGEITTSMFDASDVSPERLPSRLSNKDENQRVEDLTSKILDRVSRISISSESYTTISSMSPIASNAAAEVSFTEDEDANHEISVSGDASTKECLPSTFVVCTLTTSPIRPTGRIKRKVPLLMTTPVREMASHCMTPRTCNILRGPRPKKRRPSYSIPNSPIVNSNVRSSPVAPVFFGFTSPFTFLDPRLDKIDVSEDDATLKHSSIETLFSAAAENPFRSEQPPSGEPSPPKLTRRFRRRHDRLLSLRAKPYPFFPTLTPKF